MKIYQHVDELNDRDGIGNDILGFHSIFQKLDLVSSVVTRTNNSDKKLNVYFPSNAPLFSADDVHILHFGGTGYPVEFFKEIPGKKILRFHNMTPISFFEKFMDNSLFKTFEKNETKSYLELYSLHRSISYILHASEFNYSEYLRIVSERNKIQSKIIPVVINYPTSISTKETGFRIGFLGRWAPNKKLEDLLFTLFFLKRINPNYTLVLIGKKNIVFESYNNLLTDLIEKLDISNSIEIYENLNDQEVKAQISNLDLYLSMSEHEGFGIPILEAMAAGIPVLAFSSSAVIETVKDAGILFNKKDFPMIAELIHKILSSQNLQTSILNAQKVRLNKYNKFPFKEMILKIIYTK